MRLKLLFLLLISQLSISCFGQFKEFYKTTSNATILLYKKVDGRLVAHGTAFLLFNYDSGSDESILVTCAHVTHHDTLIAAVPATDSLKKEFLKNKRTSISFISNSGEQTIQFDGNNLLFTIPLRPDKNCFRHPDLDLATVFCDLPTSLVNKQNNIVLLSNSKTISKSYVGEKDDMYTGQEIIFVGFPSGIGTQNGFMGSTLGRDKRTNPLLRKGIISWKSDNLDVFFVDGFSGSGNSGSPVFSVPTSQSAGKLIGMVFGHLNDNVEVRRAATDTSDLRDNEAPRIHINNGLAMCIPGYIIYDFALLSIKDRAMRLSGNNVLSRATHTQQTGSLKEIPSE